MKFLRLLAFLLAAATLDAAPPESVIMMKAIGWEQTDPAGTFVAEKSRLFIGVEFGFNINASFPTLRGPSGIQSLDFDTLTSRARELEFLSQAELDRAFPDGNYTLAVSGADAGTYPFLYNPPPAPSPIRIANLDALRTVAASSLTVTWDAVPGATAGDLLSLSLENGVGTEVYASPGLGEPGALDGRSREITVTGLTPGNRYIGTLFYTRLTSTGRQPIVLTGRGVSTRFAIGYGAAPLDTVRPTITSLSPAFPAALPGNWLGPLTITFSEPMQPLTDPNRFSFGFRTDLNWSADGRTLTVNLPEPLRPGQYYLYISDNLTDLAGNPLIKLANAPSFTIAPLAPSILRQPRSHTAVAGDIVILDAEVFGSPPLEYRWHDGVSASPVSTNPQLVLHQIAAAHARTYTLTVGNATGTIVSQTATLTVLPAGSPTSRLVNLSTRTQSGADQNALFMGFVLGGTSGTTTRPLLFRGAGPALTTFGVPGALTDPTLTLFRNGSTAPLFTNDDWGALPQTAAVAAQVGAFPFASASRDAAFSQPLAAGGYSVQVGGKSGENGLALAEIYDAGTTSAPAPRLVNLSTRARVGTDEDALITGFVVGGPTSRTFLIRAVGPGLAAFGIAGALARPRLEIRDQSGAVLAANDDWTRSTLPLPYYASITGAFALATSSPDAAVAVTLRPGAYTAQVSGLANTTGVALVEVYELP